MQNGSSRSFPSPHGPLSHGSAPAAGPALTLAAQPSRPPSRAAIPSSAAQSALPSGVRLSRSNPEHHSGQQPRITVHELVVQPLPNQQLQIQRAQARSQALAIQARQDQAARDRRRQYFDSITESHGMDPPFSEKYTALASITCTWQKDQGREATSIHTHAQDLVDAAKTFPTLRGFAKGLWEPAHVLVENLTINRALTEKEFCLQVLKARLLALVCLCSLERRDGVWSEGELAGEANLLRPRNPYVLERHLTRWQERAYQVNEETKRQNEIGLPPYDSRSFSPSAASFSRKSAASFTKLKRTSQVYRVCYEYVWRLNPLKSPYANLRILRSAYSQYRRGEATATAERIWGFGIRLSKDILHVIRVEREGERERAVFS